MEETPGQPNPKSLPTISHVQCWFLTHAVVRDNAFDHSAIRVGPQWWETASTQWERLRRLGYPDRSSVLKDSEYSLEHSAIGTDSLRTIGMQWGCLIEVRWVQAALSFTLAGIFGWRGPSKSKSSSKTIPKQPKYLFMAMSHFRLYSCINQISTFKMR